MRSPQSDYTVYEGWCQLFRNEAKSRNAKKVGNDGLTEESNEIVFFFKK